MNLRQRYETRTIKIGVIELYDNGKERAIKPVSFDTTHPQSSHPEMVVEAIRMFVPNAEVYLVPATVQGMQALIDNNVRIVNLSASSTYATWFEDELAEHAFLVTSVGNTGDDGETWSARQEYWCGVGAIGEDVVPKTYSAHGHGSVVTCAPVGIDIPETALRTGGTSGAAPIVTGLLAQWYIWFHGLFGRYPTTAMTYDFIKRNSHDIWPESDFLKTGYGLLRLPHFFQATQVVIDMDDDIGGDPRYAKLIKYKEGEAPKESTADLLAEPLIVNGRTMVPSNGLTSALKASVGWDGAEKASDYIVT